MMKRRQRGETMSAEEFRDALAFLDLTQAAAADLLGVSDSRRVSEWARGKRVVPLYIAQHVRTLLKISRRPRT